LMKRDWPWHKRPTKYCVFRTREDTAARPAPADYQNAVPREGGQRQSINLEKPQVQMEPHGQPGSPGGPWEAPAAVLM
jgi:hypothetical protein